MRLVRRSLFVSLIKRIVPHLSICGRRTPDCCLLVYNVPMLIVLSQTYCGVVLQAFILMLRRSWTLLKHGGRHTQMSLFFVRLSICWKVEAGMDALQHIVNHSEGKTLNDYVSTRGSRERVRIQAGRRQRDRILLNEHLEV